MLPGLVAFCAVGLAWVAGAVAARSGRRWAGALPVVLFLAAYATLVQPLRHCLLSNDPRYLATPTVLRGLNHTPDRVVARYRPGSIGSPASPPVMPDWLKNDYPPVSPNTETPPNPNRNPNRNRNRNRNRNPNRLRCLRRPVAIPQEPWRFRVRGIGSRGVCRRSSQCRPACRSGRVRRG